MTKRAGLLLLVMTGAPAAAAAQSSVSGSAEWTVVQTANTTDSQASTNGAVWQNYSVGFHSSLVDPRILKYDTEVTFRTNRLAATGTDLADQRGRQDDLGFRLGAFVLPAGAFPFFVQASRVFGESTGELAFSNPMRGALALPTGAPQAAFDTEDRRLSVGGQLNVAGLPRAEVSYRRGQSIVTGGADRAEQQDADLSASVLRETPRTRQALRYQRMGYDYMLAQAFTQRLNNLDYDFIANVGGHVQLTGRAGQRGTFAKAELVTLPIDPGAQPYTPPPTDGRSDTAYVTGGISYEPNSRVAVRLNGTWDQQSSAVAATNAELATGSIHAEVVRGLAFNVAATSGQREQIIDDEMIHVATSNGVGGITYSGGPRWLSGTLTANVGQGTNATPQGERGITRAWAREASLSSSLGWVGIGTGYERVMNRDAILDYGNYDSERMHASVNLQSARMSLGGTAERLLIVRGYGETLARNRQETFSASLSGRLWREILITGTGGGFATTQFSAVGRGLDRSMFWSVSAQAAMHGTLRAIGWIRSEDTMATSTVFKQRGLSALARVEYRLRTLNFALEYRRNDSQLQYGNTPAPSVYRGNQLRFSLTRNFGFGI